MDSIRNKTYSLLRWSEKYTKTDMVYLTKGGFWLTLGQVIATLSSFLLAIAFANLLPKDTFGTYKFIISIIAILAIPTLQGMNTALTRSIAQGFDGSFITALKTRISWGLMGGIFSLMLSLYYFINENDILTISFLITAIFLPFMDSLTLYDSVLQGKKRFNISTRYNIFINIVATIGMVSVLYFTDNLFLILFSYFSIWTLLRFIILTLTRKKFIKNNTEDPEVIRYGKHLSLMGIIGVIASHLDKILIFHFLGATEVAIYTLAIAPPEQIKGFLKVTGSLAFPQFVNRTKTELQQTIRQKMFYMELGVIPIVILYILSAPFIYAILFPQYLDAIFLSQIFTISLVLSSALLPITALQAMGQKKALYSFNISQALLQIALIILLIPLLGLIGAIIARVVARFLNLFLSLYFFKKN